MTKSIDEWAAEQCGVELTKEIGTGNLVYALHGKPAYWTIKDPRCREIVREHFKINTVWIEKGKWRATENKWRVDKSSCIYMGGEDPEEAECNCIEAIYEAEK